MVYRRNLYNKGEPTRALYEIIYDYSDDDYDACNCTDHFEGTWSELQEVIKRMRENGCYHIDANCISEED